MTRPNPKKAMLQSAAAETYSKAGPEMKQAEPALPSPDVGPIKTDRKDGNPIDRKMRSEPQRT